MMYSIEVKGLRKSYGDIEAVKGIDFYMEEGSLFSFLGPNGAGKSTTIDMITTFLTPDAGEVYIQGYQLGKENDKIRACLGAVFQNGLLDDDLTVFENLQVRSALYGLKKEERKNAIARVMTLCELQPIAKQRYGSLSGGQKRRCDIARALLHSPNVLFLDEPTTGLDPQTRAMIWDVLTKLRKETGMSVFLTTHYMEEAAQSDYIVVINHGKIAAKGTPQELKVRYAYDRLLLYSDELDVLQAQLQQHQIAFEYEQRYIQIPLTNTMDAITLLHQFKDYIHDFEVLHGTMDDAFLSIIQQEGV